MEITEEEVRKAALAYAKLVDEDVYRRMMEKDKNNQNE